MDFQNLLLLLATSFVFAQASLGRSVETNLIARTPPVEWIPVDGKTGKSDVQKVRSHTAKQQHAKARAEAEDKKRASRLQHVVYQRPAVIYEYRDEGPIADDRNFYRDSYRGDTYQPPLTYNQDHEHDTRRQAANDDYDERDYDDYIDEEQIREIQRTDTPYRRQFHMSRSATPVDVARENLRSRGASGGRGQSITYESRGQLSRDNTPVSSRRAPSSNGPALYVERRSPTKKYVTPGEYLIPRRYRRRDFDSTSHQKRMDTLDELAKDSQSTSQPSNSSVQADFETYLAVYYEVQNNISDVLFPFFDTVLNNTNSSLIYNTVWSVFSDLTGIGPKIIGPFAFGLHCFDWIEDAYLDSIKNNTTVTNSALQSQNTTRTYNHTDSSRPQNTSSYTMNANSTKDPFFQDMLVTNYLLIQLYNYTWSQASAIANKTGDLDVLDGLTDILLSMNSSTSSSWTSPQPEFDSSYFTTYVMDRPI